MTKLQQTLYQFFGFTSFKKGQQDIIESILSGKDTIAMLPTGEGNRFATSCLVICLTAWY